MAHTSCCSASNIGRRLLLCIVSTVFLFAAGQLFAQTTVTNTATVTPPTGVINPGTACTAAGSTYVSSSGACSAADTDTVVAPLLNFTKTHAGNFTVGTNGTYTLQVSNIGAAPTTGTITVTDTLPTGLGFVSATGTGWACVAAAQLVTCTSTTAIAAGSVATPTLGAPITLTVTVAAAAAPSVTNTARASGGGDTTCPAAPAATQARCTPSDPTTVNQSVINAAKSALTVTGPNASGVYTANYTVTVTNSGSAAGTYGTLADVPVFPSSTTITGATWTTSGTGAPASGSSTFSGPYALAPAATAIAAGVTHTFAISITYSYTNSTAPTVCAATPTPGSGLYNNVTLPAGQETSTADNAACINPPLNAQVTLSKTSNGPWTVGQTGAQYTLATGNAGNGATSGTVTVVDTLPTGITPNFTNPLATNGWTCNASGQTVTCTSAAVIAAGAAGTSIALPVNVTASASTPSVNFAAISGGGDPDAVPTPGVACTPANQCATNSTVINRAQLTMTKTASAASFTVGTAASYTLQVSNTGAGATTAASTVTDTIPTGLTLGALPAGCTAAGQTVTCTVATGLAASASTSFVIPVTPTLAAGTSVTNTATVSGGGDATCPATARCTSSVTTPVNAPQLTMTKTASAASLTVGVAASYTLQVSNTGTAATTAASTITDTIPTGLTIGTLPAGCTAAGQTVTCTVAIGLAAGANTSFVIPVTPTAAATASVTNTATVSGGGDTTCPANARCTSAVTTPVNASQLTMTKTASAASFTVGVAASYTLSVQNTGTAATTAASTITDTIPTGLTLGALPAGCTAAGQTVTCTVATGLAAGASTSFVIPVTPTAAVAASVTNTATVSGGGDTTCPANARCTSAVTTPVNRSQLTMTKTASAASFTVGVAASYTLQVSNTGTAATTAASTITDTIPTGLTLGTLPAGCTAAGQTVTCTVAIGLAAGANTSFVIPVTPTAAATASVTNTATVSGGGDATCPAAARCTSVVTTPVTASADLVVAKTVNNATPTVGSNVVFTVNVTNNGPSTSTGVVVNDLLPAGYTYVSHIASVGTYVPGTGVWTLTAPLASTTNEALTITATVNATGPYANTATVTSTTTDPNAGNNSSTATTTPTASADLVVAKTVNNPTPAVGANVVFTVNVTNNGPSTSTGVVVNDLLPAGYTYVSHIASVGTYVPGTGVWTLAAPLASTLSETLTITATVNETGPYANTATVTSATTDPNAANNTGTATTTPTTNPSLTIDKTAGTPSGNTAGSTIGYSFLVTNTGNVTLTGIAVNDALLDAAAVCTSTTLIPGATTTCTGTHTITQAEVNAGTVNNSATASGTPPSGPAITSAPDTTSTPITVAPSLTIDKTAGVPSGNTAGSMIGYSFLVTNTGNVTLIGIVVNDALLDAAAVCPVTTLAPGTSTTCTGTHTISQAEINAGTVNNSATATGTPPSGPAITSTPDTTSTPLAAAPSLTIDKSAGVPSGNTAGSTIGYSFLVTNTGNVTITGLLINDANLDAAAICPVTTLAPGASTTCTGTHTITQAEINLGTVNNSATATGTPPSGPAITSTPDTTSTPITTTASLTIDKTAGVPTGNTAGSTIAYSFLVTNTGNVTLTGLLINDANLDVAATCPVTTLAPGASTTCTGTHTITQAEINAGTVNNSATATGTPPTGPAITSPLDTTSTPIAATASLTIDKTAGAPSGNTAGSTIGYSFLVTNTGNVTLTGIAVVDALLDASATCATTTLIPGANTTCTGTHTISQAEINAGTVNNSATATGTPPAGLAVTSAPDTTITPIASTPSLTIDKTAGAPSGNTAGSTIGYTFLVTNTGNVTLTGLLINDVQLDAAAVCPVMTLAPGASTTCTGTHTITQAEVNAGTVNNSATATGTPPTGPAITSPPDTTSTPITTTASLTIDKTAGVPSGNTAGSMIGYTFLVTNTGNVTLIGIVVNDVLLDAAAVCPVTTLAPGASTTCSGTHTITQAEINLGTVNNSATATGTPPSGPAITSPPDTTSTPITATASLTIDKTAGVPSGNTAGSTIGYSFLVTNTGNVTLTGLLINDANLDAAATCPATTLAPGASTTCAGTHTITQAEINLGTVNNSATATGTPPTGPAVTSPPDTTSTPLAATPSLTIDKSAGVPSGNTAGSTIGYTFLVTNTGNVTLTGLLINDANLDAAATCPVTTLAPGASTTCTGTHTITQTEVNAGTVNNSATATGTPPTGPAITSTPDTTSTPLAAAPSLTIDKSAGVPTGNTAGSTIGYTFLVTNTGNVTLTGLLINDALLDAAVVCLVTTLAPGSSTTCTGTHTITQAEINAGTVNNSATATGTPPTGPATTSPPDTTSTPITATASLTIDKTAGVPSGNTAGSMIGYSFLVTNTGNVTLTGLLINDALLDAAAVCLVTTLAPGSSTTCTGTHTITQTEVNAGTVNNSATATGTPPTGPAIISPPDTTSTLIAATASLTIDKTAGVPTGNTAGSTIDYSFLVTNTGNVTITGLLINDVNLDVTATCPVTTLAPGSSTTCTGAHTITQAEVNAGTVNNSATASGTPPSGPAITSTPDTTSTLLAAAPSLTIDKTAGVPSGNTAGNTIDYSFLVANTGNVTLTGLLINDANLDVVATCPVTTLAPGATTTCTGTHTITQAEVNLGTVNNSATATGTPPGGGTTTSPPDTTSTPIASAPALSLDKSATLADTNGNAVLGDSGDTITYSFSVTNTGNVSLAPVTVTDPLLPGLACTIATLAPGATASCAATGNTYVITVADVVAGTRANTASATGDAPGTGADPSASDTVTVVTATLLIDAVDDAFPPVNGDNGGSTTTVLVNDTLNGVPVTLTTVTLAPDTSPNPGLSMNPDGTISIAPGTPAGTYTYPYTICEVLNPGNCDTATATVALVSDFALRILKTVGVREVKTGDLVRYTLTVENIGTSNLVAGSVLDTPAAGFSYVEGSLAVVDGDNMATATGQSPIRFDGLDIAAGETATLVYAMRVGAGVRPGAQVNEALVTNRAGQSISNVSRAEVILVADAMVDDSLLLGTVFDDRDGDGWQDSAALSGVRVQGGFVPAAYVPDSTTMDRGAGPQPQADASAPMLHGIDVGAISPRQSIADPVADHKVVIRQHLNELAFTDDFVLTSAQGVSVRMDAAGNTTVEKTGEAARGLNSAEPKVQRRVARGEGGYVVDYVISNLGIDERGIPGVRIASVEGLLIETDPFGRYHLQGIAGGDSGRGRNFILKVDPSTLPPGTVFTTDNPLVRRITPGLPVRFDFGVKLPVEEIQGGEQQVELELGEVVFAPDSAGLREEYLPVIERIAAKVTEYRGGEVLISANGDSEALAFDRATAVKTALLEKVPADIASALTVSVRAEPDDPSSMVVGIAEGGPLLGTVLFDTDKSVVKPQFLRMLDKVASYLDEKGGGSVAIVGHADPRASDAYNIALGMRRAKAVYEVLAAKLSPEVRARVRVESSNDPAAPAGSK